MTVAYFVWLDTPILFMFLYCVNPGLKFHFTIQLCDIHIVFPTTCLDVTEVSCLIKIY